MLAQTTWVPALALQLVLALALAAGGSSTASPLGATVTVTVSAGAGRSVTLEAVGPAFRVGVSLPSGGTASSTAALDTLMVSPQLNQSTATLEHWPAAAGLDAGIGLRTSFGAVYLANHTATQETHLVLLDSANKQTIRGALLPHPAPLSLNAPSCETAGAPNTDKVDGQRLKASIEDLKSDCCAACQAFAGCTAWVFATDNTTAPDPNNCWLMDKVTKTKPGKGRTFGRIGGATGGGLQISLGALPSAKTYGFGGADQEPGVDGDPFAAASASPIVGNKVWRTPSYWASEGYSALGVTSTSHAAGALNKYGASWSRGNTALTWSIEGSGGDLYLTPAATLPDGVSAIAALTGAAAVPPAYAFGFLACRWGWDNRSYIEQTLHQFRDGGFPLDAFISDYGWSVSNERILISY